MDNGRMQEILDDVPLAYRAEAREFLVMPEDERVFMVWREVRELRALHRNPGIGAHLANAGYTTAAILGVAAAWLLGLRPPV